MMKLSCSVYILSACYRLVLVFRVKRRQIVSAPLCFAVEQMGLGTCGSEGRSLEGFCSTVGISHQPTATEMTFACVLKLLMSFGGKRALRECRRS